jgi:hypothetical protein
MVQDGTLGGHYRRDEGVAQVKDVALALGARRNVEARKTDDAVQNHSNRTRRAARPELPQG